DRTKSAPVVRFSSSGDSIQMIVAREPSKANEVANAPPAIEGDPLVAVRAHRVLVRQPLTNAGAQQALQPLLTGLVKSSGESDEGEAACDFKWSADGNWLMIDYDRPRPNAAPSLQTRVPPAKPLEKAPRPAIAETTAD